MRSHNALFSKKKFAGHTHARTAYAYAHRLLLNLKFRVVAIDSQNYKHKTKNIQVHVNLFWLFVILLVGLTGSDGCIFGNLNENPKFRQFQHKIWNKTINLFEMVQIPNFEQLSAERRLVLSHLSSIHIFTVCASMCFAYQLSSVDISNERPYCCLALPRTFNCNRIHFTTIVTTKHQKNM